MSRSMHGTIGAALLCCVALSFESQTQPAAPAGARPAVARSPGLIVYPAKGQTATQQSTDEQQCDDWAKTDKQTQEEQARSQTQTERQTTFKKAMGTCLTGRGYTTG